MLCRRDATNRILEVVGDAAIPEPTKREVVQSCLVGYAEAQMRRLMNDAERSARTILDVLVTEMGREGGHDSTG